MTDEKVVKNASWIIGCKIVQAIINLVIGMISARYLGPSNFGLISYAAAITAFCLPVMQLGLNRTLAREIIERPENEGETVGTALILNAASAFLCMLCVFLFLRFANAGERETVTVGVLYSISLLFHAGDMLECWFRAKLRSKYSSVAALVAYTVVAIYKVFLLVTGKPVEWFAVSNSLDLGLILVLLLLIYRKKGGAKLKFSLSLGGKMLGRSRYYIISGMLVTIFAQTDRVMLKFMSGTAENGYYSAALTCIGISGFVFMAIIDSMQPTILEAKLNDSPLYEKKMTELFCIVTYLALAQSVFMTVLARPLIRILFGTAYLPSAGALRIAVWFTTFAYYGTVRNVWILAEGKQKYLWIINLCGAGTNIALNLVLIPPLGAVGAAIASLIAQFTANVAVIYLIRPIRYSNTLMIKGLDPRPITEFAAQYVEKLKKREN